jgi:hypothetical protein
MRKNFLIFTFLIISTLLLAGCTQTNSHFYSYERGDCLTNRFDEVDDNLDINPQWRYDTIYLKWDQYSGDEFMGYYVVREDGESNTCPYYYNGADYEEYISRKSTTYYRDNDVQSGETYFYRICVKETDRQIVCGAVEKIEVY